MNGEQQQMLGRYRHGSESQELLDELMARDGNITGLSGMSGELGGQGLGRQNSGQNSGRTARQNRRQNAEQNLGQNVNRNEEDLGEGRADGQRPYNFRPNAGKNRLNISYTSGSDLSGPQRVPVLEQNSILSKFRREGLRNLSQKEFDGNGSR